MLPPTELERWKRYCAALESSLDESTGRLKAIEALCDETAPTCSRSGDRANDRCIADGCAYYAVDVNDVRAAARGEA